MGFVDEFKKATEGAPSHEAMEARERGVVVEARLREARRERDEFGATLAGIRDALGCEPGGEVDAVRLVVGECARLRERDRDADLHGDELMALADGLPDARTPLRAAEALRRLLIARLCRPLPIKPGDILTPDDFGRDEAGVLRLAALLCEAPEGAVVRSDGELDCKKGDDGAWRLDGFGFVGLTSEGVVRFGAPLTVVAWPS